MRSSVSASASRAFGPAAMSCTASPRSGTCTSSTVVPDGSRTRHTCSLKPCQSAEGCSTAPSNSSAFIGVWPSVPCRRCTDRTSACPCASSGSWKRETVSGSFGSGGSATSWGGTSSENPSAACFTLSARAASAPRATTRSATGGRRDDVRIGASSQKDGTAAFHRTTPSSTRPRHRIEARQRSGSRHMRALTPAMAASHIGPATATKSPAAPDTDCIMSGRTLHPRRVRRHSVVNAISALTSAACVSA